jgi:peptidoglycan hydrolase-like protein with peptidoglycan-binding domain
MYRTTFAILATVGLIATIPMARQSSAAVASSRREVVPLQMDAGRIRDLQTRLDQQGFSAGEIDGLWGPNTAAALRRFQAAKGLQASGRFDQATLAALGSGGSVTASPPAAPPVTAPLIAAAPASGSSAPATAMATPAPGSGPGATADRTLGTNATGTNPGGSNAGANAAGGNNNQAVTTTSTNALQPAHGANSFSKGEAGRRITRHGFQDVSDLSKDGTGVWHGTATKDGQHVRVWLDYKGNVGQQ